MSKVDIKNICISPTDTIRQAMANIDTNLCGLALIVDIESHLLGTVTDGDIRRAVLAGINLETPASNLLKTKLDPHYLEPITAQLGTPPEILLQIMQERVIRQIPLLDKKKRVAGLVTLEDLLPSSHLGVQAVVMAGGMGTRLRPLTEDLPKPMLPVGGKPLLERIINQLRDSGIRQLNVTTHYKPEKITDYFGDGKNFGVSLNYVNEDTPLGTGGALGLMPKPTEPLLVINGDILTQVNFKAMLNFHQEQHAMITMAVRRYEVQVPYGVVESDGAHVTHLREKPQIGFFVNAGIYLLEPTVFEYIPGGKHFNMTDLIQWLLDARQSVVSFPISEYWLDIGQHADYARAQEDINNGKVAK
jgi:dTDP-glucose pyrophosphorylase/CBS domain-containing protein